MNFTRHFAPRQLHRHVMIRCYSSTKRNPTPKQHPDAPLLLEPVAADMIGTPDPISNLRPVRYYIPPNETAEEREWRLMRQEVDKFNQEFWTRNNTMFMEAKEAYERQLKERGEQVTAEAMSVFYKDFLDKAYDRQMAYNRAWWKHNVSLLYPGLKASLRWLLQSNKRTVIPKEMSFWQKSFES